MRQRDRILLVVVAAVAVLGAGWLLIVKPKREDARQLQTQITAKRSELGGAAARAAQYRSAREQLRRHPQAFEEAGRALPNRVAMPELLRTLTRTARGTGVKMGDLTASAGEASTAPGISSVGLSLSFDGDFLALQRYLARLQRFVQVSRDDVAAKGRLLAVDSVQLSHGGGSGLQATVAATVYILQPGALVPGAAVSAPATGASAAAPGAPASTPAAPAPVASAPASSSTPPGGVQ